MKLRWIVYLGLACATCATIYLLVRSHQTWEATKRNNRQHLLGQAAYEGDLPTVRACVEAGADVNPGPTWESPDRPANPPLEIAADHGRVEVVRYLLEHGANPNGAYGRSPLIWICCVGVDHGGLAEEMQIAKLLLEHGADPNVHQEGTAPLAGVKRRAFQEKTGNAELISLLRQYGARD